jgi:serine/threonine protein kinase
MPLFTNSRAEPIIEIGGRMGIVDRARDTRLDRLVALKVLTTDRAIGETSKRRFLQEAKAASALNHPNIVTIYDVGSEDDVEFLAMEFIEGRTCVAWPGRRLTGCFSKQDSVCGWDVS